MDTPANVLLIEDNQGDADLVRLRLVESDPPVKVDCVQRLSEALKALAVKTPSLVLLDLNLPDSRGAETFRRVLEKARDVPIVILSGQDDEKLAMKAVHQGVQDYLIKGDITSKHLERALRYAIERQSLMRALDMARKQQIEFKNQFLSHVSHELRTPLTCIHQYVTLLLDELAGPVPAEQAEHLKTVLKSVAQLQAMIRDLLEATRAETGKLRIEQRCVPLAGLIEQAAAMMRPTAAQKRIQMEIELDPFIPLVYADPDRILEVLINLLDNAVKFTPEEGAVKVKACMIESDPHAVYISVSDTGRGISPQALPRIFERLFQDEDAATGPRSGLGLGLYIAKEIVTLHGGRMWAASEQGNGATFSFHLPVYSLGHLLMPLVTEDGKMRPSLVLVRVAATPGKSAPPMNWKATCREILEVTRRCIFVDKDLALPPMEDAGAVQMLYVVASTDMQRVPIMLRRIEAQLKTIERLETSGSVEVTAEALGSMQPEEGQSLEQQVQAVAAQVQGRVLAEIAGRAKQ